LSVLLYYIRRILVNLSLFIIIFWSLTIIAVFLLPPISTLMWARIVRFQSYSREFIPIDEISPYLIKAVVMSEDGQFCQHHGVDWDALKIVISHNKGPNRGASTLTMQVAKNMLLWPGRSYLRKALEIPLALILERVWGKKRILEIYLNTAEWGDHIFGAEAAARHYFHQPAHSLSQYQASLLATSLPNPFLRHAARPGHHQLMLRNIIETRMNSAEEWLTCLK